MRPVKDTTVAEWFRVFGIDEPAMMRLATDKAAMLEQLKSIVKFTYKTMAVTMHPDHGGDEARWKEITAAYNAIGELSILPGRSSSGPMVGIRIDFDSAWPWATTSSTSGTTNTR